MADIAIIRARRYRENARYLYEGVGAFNSTDTSGSLPVPFATVENVQLLENAAKDGLFCAETISANGHVVVSQPGGKLTISRTAGTTSGLKFWFLIQGR